MQAAAALQLAGRLQDLLRLQRKILARRNHHPEKLAGQKILLQRLQCKGCIGVEAPEARHLTTPASAVL